MPSPTFWWIFHHYLMEKSNSSMCLRNRTNREGLPGRSGAICGSITSNEVQFWFVQRDREKLRLIFISRCIIGASECSATQYGIMLVQLLKFNGNIHRLYCFFRDIGTYDTTKVWQRTLLSLIGHLWATPPRHDKMSAARKSNYNRPLSEQILSKSMARKFLLYLEMVSF